MNEHLARGYGQQLDALNAAIRAEWKWPSPSAGFACYLAALSGVPLPKGCGTTTLPTDRLARMDEAPLLASVGYAVALGLLTEEETVQAWKEGIERLRHRNPFTADRESFVFRPFELLGISLGAAHCRGLNEQASGWVRDTLRRAEVDLMAGGLFTAVLGAWAASSVGETWERIHLPSLTGLDDGNIGLIYWVVALRQELVTDEHPSLASLRLEVAKRFALTQVSESDVARAFLLSSSIRDCVEAMVVTEGAAGAAAGRDRERKGLPDGLQGALDKHMLTVIVGAGVSQGAAGLVGWAAALRASVRFLEERGGAPKALTAIEPLMDDGMFEEAAQVVEGLLRKINGKADFLRRQFHVEPSVIKDRALVEAVWRVAGNVVFTTNYDRVLELCGPPGIQTVTWREPTKMLAAIRGEAAVVHLHGVYSDSPSVVFSAGDYTRLSGDLAYQAFAQTLWTRGPLLFIGTSTSGIGDMDFSGLFQWGQSVVPDLPFTSYTLQLTGATSQEEKRRLYTDYKVEVVEYGSEHTDLGPFLLGFV